MKNNRFGAEIFAESEDGGGLLDGVANLADVMLVFACGLLLALIINWNVDVAPKQSADAAPPEIKQEMEFSSDGEENLDADAELVPLGRVYRDPATGKLYLIDN